MKEEGMGFGTVLYTLIKIAIVLFASLVLFFFVAIVLNLRGKRGYISIEEWAWSNTSIIFAIEIIITCFFFLFSLLINLIFKNWHRIQKQTIKKLAIAELSYYAVLSLLLSVLSFCSYLND